MAWQETNVQEQKELFIKAWQSGRHTKTALCGRFGISRPTGNKWIARRFEEGLVGLREPSQRPKTCANTTPPEIHEMLVAAKRERPHWGAKKLPALLRREHPGHNSPLKNAAFHVKANFPLFPHSFGVHNEPCSENGMSSAALGILP